MEPGIKEIEQIMAEFDCPKGFKCFKLGIDHICRVVDVKTQEPWLCCLDQESQECEFLFLSTSICTCPLRARLAKKMKK
jgi:hypothetical protein